MKQTVTCCLIGLLLVPAAFAQRYSVGDTVQTKKYVNLLLEPESFADEGARVPPKTRHAVEKVADNGDYVRVEYEGESGWLWWIWLESMDEVRERQQAERQKQRARERRVAEREKYLEALRDKGYGVQIRSVSYSTNSADGVSVDVWFRNIDLERRVKYATFTFQPFNPVGDPVRGRTHGHSTETVRAVGPIEPERSGRYEFENVWYNPTITCIELRRLEVEYMDGYTFTYVSDLEDIDDRAEGVQLHGDCQ